MSIMEMVPPRKLVYLPASAILALSLVFIRLSAHGIFDFADGITAISFLPPAAALPAADNNQPNLKMDLTVLSPTLRITIAWVTLYYMFLFFQAASKLIAFYAQKEGGGGAPDKKAVSFIEVKYKGVVGTKYQALILCGDRTIGNMMEQSLPFIVSLWMHALLVSVRSASVFGWAWLWFRAFYPLAFFIGPPILFCSSVPGYVCIVSLCVPIARAAMMMVIL
jgi:hypothetical protein